MYLRSSLILFVALAFAACGPDENLDDKTVNASAIYCEKIPTPPGCSGAPDPCEADPDSCVPTTSSPKLVLALKNLSAGTRRCALNYRVSYGPEQLSSGEVIAFDYLLSQEERASSGLMAPSRTTVQVSAGCWNTALPGGPGAQSTATYTMNTYYRCTYYYSEDATGLPSLTYACVHD